MDDLRLEPFFLILQHRVTIKLSVMTIYLHHFIRRSSQSFVHDGGWRKGEHLSRGAANGHIFFFFSSRRRYLIFLCLSSAAHLQFRFLFSFCFPRTRQDYCDLLLVLLVLVMLLFFQQIRYYIHGSTVELLLLLLSLSSLTSSRR